LAVNALGIYDNGPFGTTTANFATQVTLETVKPTIGIDPYRKCSLTIPYFSALKATDAATGDNTYTLDSIYGNGKIKLSVFDRFSKLGSK
jgi:hypothetical protein